MDSCKDNDININEIRYIIENNFKEIKVNSIKLIGKGNDSFAYEVNDNIVFKFPRHKKANDNLKKEIEILQFLENKLSYNIPKVMYIGYPNFNFKYTFAGFSKIVGVPLSKKLFENLSNEQKDELAKDLAKFLKELHGLHYNSYKEDIIENYKNDYNRLKDLIFAELDNNTKLRIDDIYKKILSNKDFLKIDRALIHNDFSCSNILFDIKNNKIAGVIDFGDSCVSDVDNDFYYLLEKSDEELGRKFGLKVLEYYGYENIEKILRKSDFHEFYWIFEKIIYGNEYNYQDWINEGIEELKSI